MTISLIVAVSQNGVIGKEGGLPWYLPAELARFKQITIGHPIIMGRKTHESIGRALPGRQNIVITRNQDFKAEGCEVVSSLDEALKAAGQVDEVFVIGGASIYEIALPKADKVYLTKVATDIDGDKYFSFNNSGWKLISSDKYSADDKNKFDFEFQEWVRA
jgi:dihydrofolate reductase